MSEKLDKWVVTYTQWVIRRRWLVLFAVLAAVLLAGSGGRFLHFDTSYRVFFSKDNPQLKAFEALQNIYTKNDNVLFVLEAKDGEIFARDKLAAIEGLVSEAWKIPYAIRVDAITNFQHTRANEDELIVEDLIYDAESFSEDQIQYAKEVALKEPFLINQLIAPDAGVTGINVTFQLPGIDQIKEVPEVVTSARSLADRFTKENPNMNVYLTGVVMLNNAFSEAGIKDLSTLVPIMYLLMFIIMFVILRSVTGTFVTLIIVACSSMTAMGLAGWFNVGLTPPSSQAATMIMTLAIADSIHILVSMLKEMGRGLNKLDALVESVRINFTPILLTSLTTALGFLSMNFSDSPPFRHLGNITAVGVIAAFFYSILLLPALISLLPIKKRKTRESKSDIFEKFANLVIAKRRTLLWSSALVILALASLVPKNVLNDQFVKYFDESIQFRTDSDFATQNLSGFYRADFSIGSGEIGGINNPEYLSKLDEFAEWFKKQAGILHVSSFSQIMKQVNKSMHSDQESFYKVPDSRELAAQYLLLYEMSLPYGLDLNNQINVDKSATRLNVTMTDLSTIELRNLVSKGEQWLKENAPDYMFTHGAGSIVMFSHISGRNINSMLTGTTIALILISLILIWALRSFKFGILSLLPNLVPAAIAFGIWGVTVGEINLALSMVMGMTLGIVVDDTVHFMSKYLRARREKNLSPENAVRYAFSTVGLALFGTTIILAVGFTVLAFSSFEMNSGMGQLTALTIVIALVVDYLFLPPLLMAVEGRQKETAFKTKALVEEATTA